jgi:flagellin
MQEAESKFSFQVGAATGPQNQIKVTIDSMNTAGLYMNGGAAGHAAVVEVVAVTAVAGVDAYTLTAANVSGGETITTDIMATIATNATITLKDADDVVLATADVTTANTDAENATAITTAFTAFGVTATADDSAGDGSADQGILFAYAEVAAVVAVEAVEAVAARAAIAADVNAISVEAGDGNDADVNARASIVIIDAAIKQVNIQRSELGAVSNRLNHTVNNLTNISSNLSAARGGIEDADFALETTNLAKNQILQQASTAMLAQANASKQNVLSLLQG